MPRFVCIKRCFTNTIIEEGQVVTFPSEEMIHPSVRPYFEPEPTKEEVEKMKEASDTEQLKIRDLRTELDGLGVAYDNRWGLTSLQNAVKLARRDAPPAEEERPLDRMNKTELQAKARSLGIDFPEDDTKRELTEKIIERINQTEEETVDG